MEGQLIIHGKPTEGELLSVRMFDGFEEKVYSDFFSSSTKPAVSPCYVFEIRRWKGVLYSVYSYYNDGKDKYGSGNGYCVVSLIIKEHLTLEYGKMMTILHRIYETILKDKLNIIDDSHKFLVPSLRGYIDLSILGKLYTDIASKFEWRIIPSFYSTPKVTNTTSCVNTEEATDSYVDNVLKKEGKINVSSKFPSIHEQERQQHEAISRKSLLNEKKPEQSRNNVSDENSNNTETNMLVSRIDKAEAKIIKNVEYLLSTYIPADKAGNFRDSDSEDFTAHGSNQFSLAKLSHWFTLVNCFLLFVCIIAIYRSNNNVDNNDYTSIDSDTSEVAMAIITQSELDSLMHESENLRKTIEVFNNNQWPKIDINGVVNGQLKQAIRGTLSLVFDKPFPYDKLKGEFKILDGNAAKINDNVIIPITTGYIKIGYVQNGVTLSYREIEIIP